MTDKLEQIQSTLEATEKRLKEIYDDLESLTASLAQKQTELQTAILENKNSQKIETEIMGMQIKIDGTKKALEALQGESGFQREALKAEKRAIGLANAEAVYNNMRKQAGVICMDLRKVSEDCAQMKTMKAEYLQIVRQSGAQNNSYSSRVEALSNGVLNMARELAGFLNHMKDYQPKGD